MNKERLLELADFLDNEAKMKEQKFRFRMELWLDSEERGCGTVGCVAGAAVHLFGDPTSPQRVDLQAAELLELYQPTMDQLFMGFDRNGSAHQSQIGGDSHAAAHAVRSLADTGKVDWSYADGYRPYPRS